MSTRRDLIKQLSTLGIGAAAPALGAGQTNGAQLKGTVGSWVLVGARDLRVYTNDEHGEALPSRRMRGTFIRTDTGEWHVSVKEGNDPEVLAMDITVDSPDAIAFLEVYAHVMANCVPGGPYRWSDIDPLMRLKAVR